MKRDISTTKKKKKKKKKGFRWTAMKNYGFVDRS